MQARAVVDTPAVTQAKMEAAEVSDILVDVQGKVASGCHNNKGKCQNTFDTLGDVEDEGKSDTLGVVDAETQSEQESKLNYLQTH